MANIRKRGDRWQAQVRLKGRLPVTRTFDKRTDAEAWARSVTAQVDADPRLAIVRSGRAELLTLCELLQRYLAQIVPLKRSSAQETSALRHFLKEGFCRLPAQAVTPELLSEYRDRRLKVVKPASVCRTLAIVQHAYEIAIREWGLQLPDNPLKQVKRPRLANARIRRLSENEMRSLADALEHMPHAIMRSIVNFAIATGMRRSEIISIEWSDINFDLGVVQLLQTKNGDNRVVPLSDTALDILRVLADRNPTRPFPLSANALRLSWVRLCKRCGLQDLHFHDLRHEAISRFFELGLTMPEVALISGHKDPRMLFRYANIRPSTVQGKQSL